MKSIVEEYGIRYLVHFTRANNLESIFQNGLLSVEELNKRGLKYDKNDDYRFDGCMNAISLSIEFPNYRMFYKYREQNQNVDWVVLGIKRDILWEKTCAFCSDNAASSTISSSSLQERMGVDAFKRLYEDYPGKPSRKELGLDKAIPTNPQAEVLVFDKIETEYIWGVAFQSEHAKNKYIHLLPEHVNAQVVDWIFKYRTDYEYWRS